MKPLLLRGGHLYSAQSPFATSALIAEGRFVWLGDDTAAMAYAEDAQIVDLQGALVAPAFVDAHVHLTATGLNLTGVDVSDVADADELLRRLGDQVRRHPDRIVLGHGWDETTWSNGRVPSRAELDAVAGDTPLYLTRVDVHSALVNTSLVRSCGGIEHAVGFDPEGPLTQEAHDRVRMRALSQVSAEHREAAQRAALHRAAAAGIASVHEMGGPVISDADDLRGALALGREPDLPEVVGFWGELGAHVYAQELGAYAAAGDLSVDGAIGSRTACLREVYADDGVTTGAEYIDVDEATHHLASATQMGLPAGFHVIGDRAADIVVEALERVERTLGAEAIRRAGHRLEHVEMLDARHRGVLARLGVVASMQPAFDAAWGGLDRMYAQRLGPQRAAPMNDFAAAAADGVVLAFGSDAPVTPLDPWGGVAAAVHHRTPGQGISARAAFAAHTRGGRRAAGQQATEPGVIAVDAPATYTVWAPGPLTIQRPDGRVAAWSTDPRSGTPPLPDLDAGRPECWRTVRAGVTIYDSGALP